MSTEQQAADAGEGEKATSPETPKKVAIINVVPTKDDKKLQNSITFTVDVEVDGVRRVGTFTANRPTLGMLSRIALIKAKLCGGERVDEITDYTNEMLASTQVVLTDKPDWWTPDDFYDGRPLQEVYGFIRKWVDSFRR